MTGSLSKQRPSRKRRLRQLYYDWYCEKDWLEEQLDICDNDPFDMDAFQAVREARRAMGIQRAWLVSQVITYSWSEAILKKTDLPQECINMILNYLFILDKEEVQKYFPKNRSAPAKYLREDFSMDDNE